MLFPNLTFQHMHTVNTLMYALTEKICTLSRAVMIYQKLPLSDVQCF
jgi:hypothetical protein